MNLQYLKTIFSSFYSKDTYKNALQEWRGYGLKYFFLLNFLLSIIICTKWAILVTNIKPTLIAEKIMGFVVSEPTLTFEENITRFFNLIHQIPAIKLRSREIVTEVEQPYLIIDPISSKSFAIIDTTGKTKDLLDNSASVLLTKDSLIIKHKPQDSSEENFYSVKLGDIIDNSGEDEKTINNILYILQQIPPFTFSNGQIITADNRTTKITNSSGNELAQIGPEAKLNDDQPLPILAINSDTIKFKHSMAPEAITANIKDINEDSTFAFMTLAITKIKQMALLGTFLLALPFMAISSFFVNSAMLVLYAYIGYALSNKFTKYNFEWQQMMRIAAIAITPALVVRALLTNINPFQEFLYFLIAIIYLYNAVKSITAK